MQREEIERRVLAVLHKDKRLGSRSIGPETTFAALNLDSLDVISIVFDLEDEFEVSVQDEGVRSLRTIRDAVDCIATLLRKGESS